MPPGAQPAAPDPEPAETAESDEWFQVFRWRFAALTDAGYDVGSAEVLAGRFDIDLHVAVELVTVHSCAPTVAARILL